MTGISLVSAVLWASVFLGVFALSSGYQLWSKRWQVFRALVRLSCP
ncbi:hypothetical protein [Haloprofundus halobius]|nr:hypothetical protein [Haloprofundus halobius]